MNIIRYINGEKVEEEDLTKYEVDNSIILNVLKDVNDRLKENFHQRTINSKSS